MFANLVFFYKLFPAIHCIFFVFSIPNLSTTKKDAVSIGARIKSDQKNLDIKQKMESHTDLPLDNYKN